MKVRKQIEELTISDLEVEPIWEFAFDDEDEEDPDEDAVTPWRGDLPFDPAAGLYVIRATFCLADGTPFLGYLTPPSHGDRVIGGIRPTIVTTRGHVAFWHGVVAPTDDDISEAYDRLGRKGCAVFPVGYGSDIPLADGPVTGSLNAFMHYRSFDDRSILEVKTTERCRKVAAQCLGFTLKDETWQAFGFLKRPKHGSFVQRFRPSWKVELEERVRNEMIIILTAAYVSSGIVQDEDADEIVCLYADGDGEFPDPFRHLGYPTAHECVRQVRHSIREYVRAGPHDWHTVLLTHLDPDRVPDRELAARLLVGCVRVATNVQLWIAGQEWARR